jgi:hypothetical protein
MRRKEQNGKELPTNHPRACSHSTDRKSSDDEIEIRKSRVENSERLEKRNIS